MHYWNTTGVFCDRDFKQVLIAKLFYQFTGVREHVIEVNRLEFGDVGMHATFPWLVDLRSSFLARQSNVFIDKGTLQRIHIQDEFDQLGQGGYWLQHEIFIPDDMDRSVGFQPKLVEIFPYTYLLLNELGPVLWEPLEISVIY